MLYSENEPLPYLSSAFLKGTGHDFVDQHQKYLEINWLFLHYRIKFIELSKCEPPE